MKFNITKAEFDALSGELQKLYKANGDGYQMQVEGAVDKAKLDEFRDNNTKLQGDLKKFEGVDLDAYATMTETQRKLEDKKLIDSGDIDGLIEKRLAAITADHDGKMAAVVAKLDSANANTSTLLTRYEIEGAASKALAENKIRPEMCDAVTALVKSKFALENGVAVAKDGDNYVQGASGNLTISEFVASQPDGFKIGSGGGGANGSNGDGGQSNAGMTSTQKIAAGLRKLA